MPSALIPASGRETAGMLDTPSKTIAAITATARRSAADAVSKIVRSFLVDGRVSPARYRAKTRNSKCRVACAITRGDCLRLRNGQACSPMSTPDTIASRLDALPGGWPVWRLIVMVSLGGCFEFYDLMMTAYISPVLVQAGIFHVGKAGVLGQSDQAVFAAATFTGLFIGALAFSRLADRFGRRSIFTASLIWYALGALAMAASSSAIQLHLWRLVSSIGIGVELVTIDTYVSEIAPARLRGRAFALNQAIQFTAVPVAGACRPCRR
jgi:hypothetical protein